MLTDAPGGGAYDTLATALPTSCLLLILFVYPGVSTFQLGADALALRFYPTLPGGWCGWWCAAATAAAVTLTTATTSTVTVAVVVAAVAVAVVRFVWWLVVGASVQLSCQV